jgi:hypothetical protein
LISQRLQPNIQFLNGNVTLTTTEVLLEKSIDQYRELLEKTRSVKYAIKGSDPEKIKTLASAIDELQKKAEKIEQKLVPFFKQEPELTQSPKFLDRLTLIKLIIQLTESYSPNIKAIMTINRNEMKKISSGRAIMDKYHNTPKNKGGVINSTG